MNSKQKGDICLSQAIAYYVYTGCEVLLPLGDRRPYDLVIETPDSKLSKVQCKYTSSKNRYGRYIVDLRVTGGNQSFTTSKFYENGDFDILFVCTDKMCLYSIPSLAIESNAGIVLGEKYETFKHRTPDDPIAKL